MQAMNCPMDWTWRLGFVFLAGLGLFALGYGVVGLTGRVEVPEARVELVACIVVGGLLQPFGWTALRHAKLALTDTEITFLGFGFVCSTRRVRLADIARFGVGVEKSSGGGKERILLLEMHSGERAAIKVEMYRDCERFLAALEQRTGLAPAPTKRTIRGAQFADPEDPAEPG
jgi:hypothetical protein